MIDWTSLAPKSNPNHKEYLRALRRLIPQQRLQRPFELTERTRRLFKAGLRLRFPDLSKDELHQIYLKRLAKGHNRNY